MSLADAIATPRRSPSQKPPSLEARRLGIDTLDEAVVFLRSDCPVCRSEGFESRATVRLRHGSREIVATLYHVTDHLLGEEEAGLSDAAWARLGLAPGDRIDILHQPPLASMSAVRGKLYGRRFSEAELGAILADAAAGRYTEVELAAFVCACSARPLDREETIWLTRAMVDAGDRLSWDGRPILDKHSVGGLPGNRTTPIVVAIVTALGQIMPKTSSRAITSPARTAHTIEVLTRVDLDLAEIRRVVESEGGCLAWGGGVRLSPADDILIRVERALDLDSEGQLVGSVLSKKIAAGATHLVLDMPVGPTAKVRSREAGDLLARRLEETAAAFGLKARVIATDGAQPVGRGIGPALEARDVLAVLKGDEQAPQDLADRAVMLAGAVLELAGAAPQGGGEAAARAALADGRAWAKFQRICAAQGGLREPPLASHKAPVPARISGRLAAIDNRRLARVAKLAGAPEAKAAGVELHQWLGNPVEAGEPLFTVHAETPGELAYALDYVAANPDMLRLDSD
jgi:thymidine phosphorylase